jgi:hypothetical protein
MAIGIISGLFFQVDLAVNMADVVSILLAKRAELAEVIARLEQNIRQNQIDLAHVDGTIRLFSPNAAPETAGSGSAGRRQQRFRPGELARGILDVLRRAGRPLTAGEVATTILVTKGMDAGDPNSIEAVQKLVHRGLVYHQRRGTVVHAGRDGRAMRWALAD